MPVVPDLKRIGRGGTRASAGQGVLRADAESDDIGALWHCSDGRMAEQFAID